MPPVREERSVITRRAQEEAGQSLSRSAIQTGAVEGQTYSPVVKREVQVLGSRPPASTFSTTHNQKGNISVCRAFALLC